MDAGLATILIVDDSPENLAVLSELLQTDYRVRAATSGDKALRVVKTAPKPDLILLDVMMPEMDGYEVFARLRADTETRDIPVIFVTAMDSTEAEIRGLDVGAVDYIAKPIVPPILRARVHTQLELKQARDWLANQNAYLEVELARRMSENLAVQDVSIHALAHLAEIRDPETGNHLRRTQGYVHALAEQLANHPRFRDFLNPRAIDLLVKSAPLHDIGKVGIPDHILLKAGKLTPEEWDIMKTHAKLGRDAIEQAERDVDRPLDFLVMAKDIAHYHHERWDGGGYPEGLAGDAIPIAARLMALADVFDALISQRVYKPPMSFEDAYTIIAAGRGTHFDPDVVDAFIARFDEFCQIAIRYGEAETAALAQRQGLAAASG
ncbi:putative two-component system response regulator [Allochromatium warmingii]|uniref:Putative two-component system response regulator n=1 Tax=Allochromatium warmingii TaxID=61595 RepID=A0A1H3IQ48_ALLWA|nr:two-component system response regulator [Allochromatium warmingii]SDY29389.1 putative two-component system response regulator [Allochromatium warmingii]